MKDKIKIVIVAALAVILAAPLLAASGGSQDSRSPQERVVLFNGKDLSNFYTWLVNHHRDDPNRVISVVDQVDGAPAIRVSGEDWGGFATEERFHDYHLVVEFRWGLVTWGDRKNATRDSGVLVHCQGDDGNTGKDFNGPWMRSIEAQVIEGGVGDFILVAGYDADGTRLTPKGTATVIRDRDGEAVYSPEGKPEAFQGGRINWYGRDPDWTDQLGFRGKDDVESELGGWTRLEVICRGDSITNVVNGKVVNRLTGASQNSGRIMFQSEGAEIFFRKIEVLPLD